MLQYKRRNYFLYFIDAQKEDYSWRQFILIKFNAEARLIFFVVQKETNV